MSDSPGILLKCRFSSDTSGMHPKPVHFHLVVPMLLVHRPTFGEQGCRAPQLPNTEILCLQCAKTGGSGSPRENKSSHKERKYFQTPAGGLTTSGQVQHKERMQTIY